MDCVVGDWQEALLGGGSKRDTMVELSIDDTLHVYDDEDGDHKDKVEGEDYFDTIMRRDLGDDYESLFDDGDDTMDKGLLRLFSDTSSLKDGSLDNDDHGVEELMADINDIRNKEYQFNDSRYNCLVK